MQKLILEADSLNEGEDPAISRLMLVPFRPDSFYYFSQQTNRLQHF
jgi:hypothetical protein